MKGSDKKTNGKQANNHPKGQLTIQTIAMPADANSNGDIFGGWIVSQMDLAGGVLARQTAPGRTATVAINSMEFHRPVHIGDLVCCYADLQRIGNTSMTIKVEVWTISGGTLTQQHVTQGIFIYVAIDDQGKPRLVPSNSKFKK